MFNVCLHMLNLMVSSSKVDQDPDAIAKLRQMLVQEDVIIDHLAEMLNQNMLY